MIVTKTLTCKSNIRLTEYGVVLPYKDMEIEVNLSEPEINTVIRKDTQNNDITLHEVIFKISCATAIQDGYITRVVEDFEGSEKNTIITKALEML
jgi:hypothetical protein|nr:MAG TPA: hypothetical protein [Caudoviricetes sp.]